MSGSGKFAPEFLRTLSTRMITNRNLGSGMGEKADGGCSDTVTTTSYECDLAVQFARRLHHSSIFCINYAHEVLVTITCSCDNLFTPQSRASIAKHHYK